MSTLYHKDIYKFEKPINSYWESTVKHKDKFKTLDTDISTNIVVIGGGDTASAIINLNMQSEFTHVSTGGGASLELLSGNKLELIKSWENYE